MCRVMGYLWAVPEVNQIKFRHSDCNHCSVRYRCTRSKRGLRYLGLLPQRHHEALQQARKEQKTAEFWKKYTKRSGIEGIISQGVRAFDLRCTRYISLAKTNLQMVVTSVAINIYRLFNWVLEIPLAATRISHFARLSK